MTYRAFLSSKGLVRGLALILAAAGAVACGAPSYTYVADSPDGAYFKVPWGWRAVPHSALTKAVSSSAWLTAYGEDSATAAASSVYSFGIGKPFVLAEVGALSPQGRAELSYDALTDIFLPVTSAARAQAAGQLPVTGFQLLRQSRLTPGHGVHGVRVTYAYTSADGSARDTFDQVALTNADQTKVYVLIVHCTSACYSRNQNAISDIVSSFTVRSPS